MYIDTRQNGGKICMGKDSCSSEETKAIIEPDYI